MEKILLTLHFIDSMTATHLHTIWFFIRCVLYSFCSIVHLDGTSNLQRTGERTCWNRLKGLSHIYIDTHTTPRCLLRQAQPNIVYPYIYIPIIVPTYTRRYMYINRMCEFYQETRHNPGCLSLHLAVAFDSMRGCCYCCCCWGCRFAC